MLELISAHVHHLEIFLSDHTNILCIQCTYTSDMFKCAWMIQSTVAKPIPSFYDCEHKQLSIFIYNLFHIISTNHSECGYSSRDFLPWWNSAVQHLTNTNEEQSAVDTLCTRWSIFCGTFLARVKNSMSVQCFNMRFLSVIESRFWNKYWKSILRPVAKFKYKVSVTKWRSTRSLSTEFLEHPCKLSYKICKEITRIARIKTKLQQR